ncbi:YhgE/Pip domain-containing protein [Clostridium niameyense]|uniref:YhgE/Pip domain-containing protein n=1 Tax=Clostridium niameyense TaxID=1622073 RepID=A0A6M0RDA2_9CLOT|nr:YhgE/Pip domain-containing protein [Clostridium niameyense]NEZ47770.1 YhgE/Pip domain-containing protein [Clostridium niameyense]
MKNIFKIYKRDIKSTVKNPITILIVLGICFLPSLYAWVNIAACWNPYENTSTVPIAVVNKDKNVLENGKKINVGNEVIKELKKNTALNWKFVNSKDANLGVVSGNYYAMIEIPEDFSKNLTSILHSDKPKKPTIIYKVNTKSNPVAGKITGVAKSEIVNNINSNFVNTVNKTVFYYLNQAGKKAEDNKDNILKLKKGVIELNSNLDSIKSALDTVSSHGTTLSEFSTNLKKTMPSINNGLNSVKKGTVNTQNLISNVKKDLDVSFSNTQLILNEIQGESNKLKSLIYTLKTENKDKKNIIYNAITTIDHINNNVNSLISYLENISKVYKENKNIPNMISSLNKLKEDLNAEKEQLNKLQNNINDTSNLSEEIFNSLNDKTNNIENQVSNSLTTYSNAVRPSLNNIANNLIASTENASSILDSSQGMFNQIDNLLNYSSEGSKLAVDTSKNLSLKLEEFKGLIGNLSNELKKVDNNDLNKIITIFQTNPELMGNFVANPFNLKEESIYKMENYGSGMAPIYTTLSLWVGALILTSIFKTTLSKFEDSENITLKEEYLGKMLFFITIAVIQGLIVALGDKFLLGVQTSNLLLLLLFAIISSLTFSIIVYTLVSILRNVGKALSIILLVIQIAGCGGSYPIQVDPVFFRILQPFFPFTYSVNGFREAIAGPLVSKVLVDLVALITFALVTVLIGYLLKTPLNPLVDKFEEKFEESGIGE